MAMDVVHVLKKGRHDFRGLKTSLVAERAEDEPRRFTSVAMHFTVAGNVPPEPVQRAIDLSRDKYLFGLELASTGHRAEGDVHSCGRLTTDHGRNAVTPQLPGLLRGLAVLIMIEAHVLDSWTRFPDRQTRQFAYAMVLGGFGAPLFLFLAGVAVPLSAGSKSRRTGDAGCGRFRAVVRRGLEVFGLAFLFRIQAWVLGWSSPPVAPEGRHPQHHGAVDHGRRGDLGSAHRR